MTRLVPPGSAGKQLAQPQTASPASRRIKRLSRVAPLVLALGVFLGGEAAPVLAACLQVWPYPVLPVHKQTDIPRTPTFQWRYFEPDKPWLQQETGKTGYYANVYIYKCNPTGQDPPLWDGDPNSYPTPQGCQTIGVCYSGARNLEPWTELSYDACWKWDAANNNVIYEPLPPLERDQEYWWYVTTACENVVQFYEGEAWRFHTGPLPSPTSAP